MIVLCSQAAQAQALSDDHLGNGNHGKNGIIYNWFHKVEILEILERFPTL